MAVDRCSTAYLLAKGKSINSIRIPGIGHHAKKDIVLCSPLHKVPMLILHNI